MKWNFKSLKGRLKLTQKNMIKNNIIATKMALISMPDQGKPNSPF